MLASQTCYTGWSVQEMAPISLEVTNLKVKSRCTLKRNIFPVDIYRILRPRFIKLGSKAFHDQLITPIAFEVTKLKAKVRATLENETDYDR